jgi:hypothetical protein
VGQCAKDTDCDDKLPWVFVSAHHQGMATHHHTPLARGYDHSLWYWEHMNSYNTQQIEPTGTNCKNRRCLCAAILLAQLLRLRRRAAFPCSILDLWEDGAPATSIANEGHYIEDLFFERALAHIQVPKIV